MATANPKLIDALHTAADKIAQGAAYEWGHMGGCNCGHLAQELTQLSRADIHAYAQRKASGDWSEQVEGYCETSAMDMDLLIAELMSHGLERTDLINLERLADPAIAARVAPARPLRKNQAEDASAYMHAWAELLEEELQPA